MNMEKINKNIRIKKKKKKPPGRINEYSMSNIIYSLAFFLIRIDYWWVNNEDNFGWQKKNRNQSQHWIGHELFKLTRFTILRCYFI